tara:strand:- start:316 stop:534 length:219 start_codon:yes stop_codon:yes gene_type:complete
MEVQVAVQVLLPQEQQLQEEVEMYLQQVPLKEMMAVQRQLLVSFKTLVAAVVQVDLVHLLQMVVVQEAVQLR